MDKLDLRKDNPTYYKAKQIPELVKFEKLVYASVNGTGVPSGEGFIKAIEALYTVAYSIKSLYKTIEKDFSIPNLEGLWWVDACRPTIDIPRDEWNWKLLIQLPNYITDEYFSEGKANAKNKKPDLDIIDLVKFESIHEPKAVQMLHVGPYSTESDTIEIIHNFMKDNNLSQNGLHHEIYLSNPHKTDSETMKTILRIPVKAN